MCRIPIFGIRFVAKFEKMKKEFDFYPFFYSLSHTILIVHHCTLYKITEYHDIMKSIMNTNIYSQELQDVVQQLEEDQQQEEPLEEDHQTFYSFTQMIVQDYKLDLLLS